MYSQIAVLSDMILLLREYRKAGPADGRPLIRDPSGLWILEPEYPKAPPLSPSLGGGAPCPSAGPRGPLCPSGAPLGEGLGRLREAGGEARESVTPRWYSRSVRLSPS